MSTSNDWKALIEQYPRFASLIKEYRNDAKGALKHLKNAIYTLPNTDVPASAQLFYRLFGLEAIYQSGIDLSKAIWQRWFTAMPITRQEAVTYIKQYTLPYRDTLLEVVYRKSNNKGWADESYLCELSIEQIEDLIDFVQPTKDGIAYLLAHTPELTMHNACYTRWMAIRYAIQAGYDKLLIGLKDRHDELALWQAQNGYPLMHLANHCSLIVLETLLTHGYGHHLMPFEFFAHSRKLRPLFAYWLARQEQTALCEMLGYSDRNVQAALVIGGYHPDWLVGSDTWVTQIRRYQLKHPDLTRSELLKKFLPHLAIVDPE